MVAPQPFYQDRGTPICVRQVIDALLQLGYEVDILTYPVGGGLPGRNVRLFRSSNPFRITHVPVGFSFRKLLLDATLFPKLRNLLRSVRERACAIENGSVRLGKGVDCCIE